MAKNTVQTYSSEFGWGWTTAKRAERYVATGRAHLTAPGMIEFIPDDYRQESVDRLSASQRPRFLSNGDGMASVQAIRNLPMAGDIPRFLTGKRPDPVTLRDRPTREISRTPSLVSV